MRKISYCQAITEAMRQEMRRDPSVFVYGIGVPDHKRIFGSTSGLVEEFGSHRCFDTPLSEDAMTGFGLGAAISGMRPIHVHIRVDFMLLGMNQLANMIASYNYASCGRLKVPLVIRVVVGRGWGQSFQHSKAMHSVFAHIPGLKIVMPTTPYDAKGLLISSIRDNNPVIFFEHRWLYFAVDTVPEKPYTVDFGKANILRKGSDVTIVAVSWMNVEALKAAEILEKKHHVSVEVVDPRTIVPFDENTILKSVKKTRHCIVADYDWLFCGLSAEIAARVYDECSSYLKSPVSRLGFAPTHCPGTRPLENLYYPNAINIIREVEKKLRLKKSDISKEDFFSHEKRFKGPF